MSPVIEGLRGLGALMVLVHHYVYSLSPEWAEALTDLHFFHVGVDLFFVLTGYLFAPLVLGVRHQPAGIFLKRRFWRLYPLYLVSLILTLILAPSSTLQTWFENATQTSWQVLHHLVFLQAAPWQNLHQLAYFSEVYWTLTVEVAFYALVLACLFLPAKLSVKQRFWGMAVLSLVGFLGLYLWQHQPSSGRWFMRQAQMPTLLIEFWFGMAVFYLADLKKIAPKKTNLLLAAAVGLLIGFYMLYPLASAHSISPRPFGWFNVGVAFAFALLLAGLLSLENQLQKNQQTNQTWVQKLPQHLGALSYGVYLLHGLSLRLVAGWFESPNLNVLAAALVACLLAAILYHWFEKPCRNFGRR